MIRTEFTLPPKCRIGTVTIRKTFGTDESEALVSAKNNGTDAKDELIDLSIVATDGAPCLPGDSGYDRWPTKTRAVVRRFFESLNDVDGVELIELIEDAEESGTVVVDGQVETTYELPDGCGIGSITLKEMMEADERAASAAGENVSEVMISRCVVRTDKGQSLSVDDLRDLSTRTRNAITVFWSGMNFVPEDELAPLIKAAEAAKAAMESLQKTEGETSVAESSQSGCGSQAQVDVG